MKEDLNHRLLLKQEVKMAFEAFKEKYTKPSKGIQKLYEDIMMTKELTDVVIKANNFFGYMQKSKKAKEKWSNEPL